jgi:hypothetical protein
MAKISSVIGIVLRIRIGVVRGLVVLIVSSCSRADVQDLNNVWVLPPTYHRSNLFVFDYKSAG